MMIRNGVYEIMNKELEAVFDTIHGYRNTIT